MMVKACKECGRVNALDEETCISCGSEDFDELDLVPFWNSIEPYIEEENSESD